MKLLPVAFMAMMLPLPLMAQSTGSVGDALRGAADAAAGAAADAAGDAADAAADAAGGSDVAAPAGYVLANDPQRIADLIKDAGYRAELTTDDQGDPKINSAASGANFAVYFYGCTDGAACTSIQFSAGFDTEKGLDLSVANDWNTDKRYGKVYLDNERDPYLEMDLDLDMGGISQELFKDNLQLWDRMLADFQSHINW